MTVRDRIEVGVAGERLAVRLDRAAGEQSDRTYLYLHGLGTDQEGEKAVFFRRAVLASGHGFASFDFRGHGQSEGALASLSVSRNLEDAGAVAHWLRGEGCQSLALIGSSMGGGCALWLAALRPELAEVVATIAPALDLPSGFLKHAGEDGRLRWREDGMLEFRDGERSMELEWGFVEDGRNYPLDRLAESLNVPSLVLQGRLDDRVDWRGATRLAGACPQVELHLFEDGDHRLADRKERLWRLIEGFVAARAPAPGS